MSKTTRSQEKAQSKALSKSVASVKEKKSEKKPPAAAVAPAAQAAQKKQPAGRISTASSVKTANNSVKKETARQKTAAAVKPARTRSAPVAQNVTPVSREDTPSQLLRRTKTTASALAQLEKGIEFIHRKDFKKAVAELQSLIEKYKNEAEITASARSYLDICKCSEARQKKTAPTAQNQTYAMGVLEHNRTNYDKAVAYFRQSLEIYPRADYIYYSIAASLALKGDVSSAIENLRKAVELNRDSLVHAKNDPDFASLENDKEFLDLIGVPAPRHK